MNLIEITTLKMEKEKSKLYLIAVIFLLIIINVNLIIKVDSYMLEWKRFTYEDWVALYNICQKNWGPKDTIRNRIYEDNNTDFREFILWK